MIHALSPAPNIEPGIAPLCAALNRAPDVTTIWSCEGHPSEGHRPYVVFAAPQAFAFAIDRALSHPMPAAAELQFVWKLMANFRDDGTLQWIIDPNDERFSVPGLFGRARWTRKLADADIAVLARLVDELRGEFNER